ncbi:MAG TPA: hypothetical protein VFW70_01770 [Methylomirabilota bacterium]|nr:hypothetical protein [Methylomirabilota bacterium]
MTAAVIEPFGFFTVESLRAGWWLTWRLFVRVAAIFGAAAVVGLVLMPGGVGSFLMALGFCAGAVWSIILIPKLTSQWAQQEYGYPLENALRVWWGITWRGLVVSLVAAVIMAVPNVVALSLKTAYAGSVLGAAGSLVIWLLNVTNIAVSIMATGWAMSKVTAEQLGGLEPLAPVAAAPAPMAMAPVEADPPAAAPQVAPAPRRAPGAAPAVSAPRVMSAEGKRQCPKCGLYETERGSVIGWYCKVCGWRERRR